MPPERSEHELIASVIADEAGARDRFVTQYWRFVHAVVRRAAPYYTSALEEVPQEVLLHLFEDDCRRLRQWRGEGDFVSWLAPVVRNTALTFLERRYPSPQVSFPSTGSTEYPWDPPDPGTGPDAALVALERASILGSLMERLSQSDRDLLTEHLLEDVPAQDIAIRLGIEVNAVYQRIHRALRRLESLARVHHPDLFLEGSPVRAWPRKASGE